MENSLHQTCRKLQRAYRTGKLGQTRMPEDSSPGFAQNDVEGRLAYFTLPMALNYQRDSYKLWEAALKTWNDKTTRKIFDIASVAKMPESELRKLLMKHKLALQPNKHIATWKTIADTVHREWGSFDKFLKATGYDFLRLRDIVQKKHKKGFPYLSGPKIFNYWAFVLGEYGEVKLKNRESIEIAPDTHILQCSLRLGVISDDETEALDRNAISLRWREALSGSGIDPIEMHPPLWFWSRNGFIYEP